MEPISRRIMAAIGSLMSIELAIEQLESIKLIELVVECIKSIELVVEQLESIKPIKLVVGHIELTKFLLPKLASELIAFQQLSIQLFQLLFLMGCILHIYLSKLVECTQFGTQLRNSQ